MNRDVSGPSSKYNTVLQNSLRDEVPLGSRWVRSLDRDLFRGSLLDGFPLRWVCSTFTDVFEK